MPSKFSHGVVLAHYSSAGILNIPNSPHFIEPSTPTYAPTYEESVRSSNDSVFSRKQSVSTQGSYLEDPASPKRYLAVHAEWEGPREVDADERRDAGVYDDSEDDGWSIKDVTPQHTSPPGSRQSWKTQCLTRKASTVTSVVESPKVVPTTTTAATTTTTKSQYIASMASIPRTLQQPFDTHLAVPPQPAKRLVPRDDLRPARPMRLAAVQDSVGVSERSPTPFQPPVMSTGARSVPSLGNTSVLMEEDEESSEEEEEDYDDPWSSSRSRPFMTEREPPMPETVSFSVSSTRHQRVLSTIVEPQTPIQAPLPGDPIAMLPRPSDSFTSLSTLASRTTVHRARRLSRSFSQDRLYAAEPQTLRHSPSFWENLATCGGVEPSAPSGSLNPHFYIDPDSKPYNQSSRYQAYEDEEEQDYDTVVHTNIPSHRPAFPSRHDSVYSYDTTSTAAPFPPDIPTYRSQSSPSKPKEKAADRNSKRLSLTPSLTPSRRAVSPGPASAPFTPSITRNSSDSFGTVTRVYTGASQNSNKTPAFLQLPSGAKTRLSSYIRRSRISGNSSNPSLAMPRSPTVPEHTFHAFSETDEPAREYGNLPSLVEAADGLASLKQTTQSATAYHQGSEVEVKILPSGMRLRVDREDAPWEKANAEGFADESATKGRSLGGWVRKIAGGK